MVKYHMLLTVERLEHSKSNKLRILGLKLNFRFKIKTLQFPIIIFIMSLE